jgi:hypothetical protein
MPTNQRGFALMTARIYTTGASPCCPTILGADISFQELDESDPSEDVEHVDPVPIRAKAFRPEDTPIMVPRYGTMKRSLKRSQDHGPQSIKTNPKRTKPPG